MPRRRLLTAAPALSGAGFALWTFLPSYPAFAAGFVLWGAGSSLRSGTLEALVHDELAAVGAPDRFPRLLGRSRALGTVAEMAATALAAPVLALGGHRAAGIASVLVCAAGVLVARAFPESRPPGRGERSGQAEPEPGFWQVLGAGWTEVRTVRPARRAVLLVSVLTGALAYDEYVPLLAASTGAAAAQVPLLVLLVSAGAAAGNWCVGRGPARTAPALVLAVCALVAGALSGSAAGLVLVAAGYGLCTWAATTAEARLQERVSDRARATVSSMAGFGSEVVSVLTFAAYGAGSLWFGPGPLFALAALPYLAIALATRRRGRRHRRGPAT